jgi:DNA-binding response OmpR family regulator
MDASGAPRALIVVGEALANLISVTLQHGRYETRTTTDPSTCREILRTWSPHVALIDLDRSEHFIELLHEQQAPHPIPTIALTRRRDTAVKLKAFESGVDDIIEVPFTLDEIVARPFALIRRVYHINVPIVPKIRLDGLEVDLIEQRVRVGRRDLQLTPIQQTLLYLLAANAGRALSREELLNTIWGELEIESNVVDRHIRELRVKLNDDWRTPQFIETVAGNGYRFKSQHSVPSAAK